MGRRGRKRRLDLESEYWALLANGVGTVQACKLLGIGRKTGYRWRAENGGLAPERLPETSRTGRFLSLLERQRIATLRARRRRGSGDRAPARPCCVDGQPGAAPQPAPARRRGLRRRPRPRPSSRPDPADAANPAEPRPWAAAGGAGKARAGVESGTDRRAPAPGLSGPAVVASVPRDDLPGALPRREGRSVQDVDPAAAHRAPAAQTPPPTGHAADPVQSRRPG